MRSMRRMGQAPGSAVAVAGQAIRDSRVLLLGFAYLFAAYSYIQPAGYRSAYSTRASREAFAGVFGKNTGLRLLYGRPHDLLTVAGYSAWRVGGVLAIGAAIFGLLAAARVLRGDEDAGRMEVMLAGAISRRGVRASQMTAIAAGIMILWFAEFAGLAIGGLPTAGAAYLALATASVAAVLAGVGAVVSQVAGSRRGALALGGGAVALFFALRVIADTAGGAQWLNWATPLGWAEQMRPFTGARPVVLLLPAVTIAMLLLLTGRLSSARDIGGGLLRARGSAPPRLWFLSSPTTQAVRAQVGNLIAWAVTFAAAAFIFGVVASSASAAGIPASMDREFAKLGTGSIETPAGYLAFIFMIVVLAVSIFACAQIGSARREEAGQRLETLLALPVARARWLAGRLTAGAGATVALALLAGLLAWAGAAAGGAHVALAQMIEAGANSLPAAMLFLGIAALAYAVAPRANAAFSYGLLTVAFLWQATASLLSAPRWVTGLTPFAHVALVPAQAFRPGPAAIMVGLGVAAASAAIAVFRHRDLIGA